MENLRRAQNAMMRAALQKLIAKADDLLAAIDGTTGQFESEVAALSSAASEAERLLEQGGHSVGSPTAITVHIEGGMVQGVSGIPTGYALHVQDHDIHDEEHPQWDPEKECIVTAYEGAQHENQQ